ncbi:hypothetical protein DTO195F2_5431 [Paecilomyces variotii]|nr:hypothetical protein DTO195F2_5431 [Paecilomyces variotii]
MPDRSLPRRTKPPSRLWTSPFPPSVINFLPVRTAAIINEEFGYPRINISIPFDHLPFPPLRDAFPLVAPFEGANTYLLPLPSPSKTS